MNFWTSLIPPLTFECPPRDVNLLSIVTEYLIDAEYLIKMCYLGGHHFLWNGGVMNFWKYLGNIFETPYLMIKNFMNPPSGAAMLKKHVTPNACSTENMHFGAISSNKIFIKICSHPIISLFFLWPPYFSWKNSVTPPAFSWPPLFGRKW